MLNYLVFKWFDNYLLYVCVYVLTGIEARE